MSPVLIGELLEDGRLVSQPSGAAANRGTAIHNGSEAVLKGEMPREMLVGYVCPATFIQLDEEMAAIAESYIDLVQGKVEKDRGHLRVEVRAKLTEECWGTVDSAILSPQRLRVWDLKTGSGHIVFARDNWQLGIYGAAVLREVIDLYDEIKTIELGICQPPLNHFDRQIHSPQSLLEIGDKVEAKIAEIKSGRGEFKPTEDNCRWCPARALCPELKRNKVAFAIADFERVVDATDDDMLALPSPQDLGGLDFGEMLELVPLIKLWCDGVESQARQMLLTKAIPEGDSLGKKFKVVEGRIGNRAWADETAVMTVAEQYDLSLDEAYEKPVPKSPSALEKAIKTKVGKEHTLKAIQAVVNSHVTRAPGQPTVVPAGDPRDPIDRVEAAAQDFAGVFDDDEV